MCDVMIYCLAQSQYILRTVSRILSITRKFDLPLQWAVAASLKGDPTCNIELRNIDIREGNERLWDEF